MSDLLPTLERARDSLEAGRRDHATAQAIGAIIADITKRAEAFAPLTLSELHILQLIAQGRTNSSIALTMKRRSGTIRNHVTDILRKLDLDNRAEAAAFAVHNDIDTYLRNRS